MYVKCFINWSIHNRNGYEYEYEYRYAYYKF